MDLFLMLICSENQYYKRKYIPQNDTLVTYHAVKNTKKMCQISQASEYMNTTEEIHGD